MLRPPSTCSCDWREATFRGVEAPVPHAMTTYRILYWQEVPSQVRAEDDEGDEVSLPLSQKFQVRIDALAAARGLEGADD